MKKTQIVTHLMPSELEDYSDMLDKLNEGSRYLESHDWISIQCIDFWFRQDKKDKK